MQVDLKGILQCKSTRDWKGKGTDETSHGTCFIIAKKTPFVMHLVHMYIHIIRTIMQLFIASSHLWDYIAISQKREGRYKIICVTSAIQFITVNLEGLYSSEAVAHWIKNCILCGGFFFSVYKRSLLESVLCIFHYYAKVCILNSLFLPYLLISMHYYFFASRAYWYVKSMSKCLELRQIIVFIYNAFIQSGI